MTLITPSAPQFITSRDNPTLKLVKRLAQDNTAYRKEGKLWIEGEHLCSAALARGVKPLLVVAADSYWPCAPVAFAKACERIIVVPDALLHDASGLESPAPCGFVMALPEAQALDVHVPSVVLDGVQDAGNVGSILRSASAFGFKQVIAIKGSAALWSPKVVRSGMGAHFALNLIEAATVQEVQQLQTPLAVTSSHRGQWLHEHAAEPGRLKNVSWVLGHEGQGVRPELEAAACWHVRIPQPGGEESLNVAAAAAICLHASAVDGLK
jgi:RNA methyltransferase, TrmH family